MSYGQGRNEQEFTSVRFGYTDLGGVNRCKAVGGHRLEQKLTEGVGLSRAQMAMNMLDQLCHIEGMEAVGEVRLMPDPKSLRPLPWAPGHASVACDLISEDERGWEVCPRRFLKSVVDRLAAAGVRAQAAFETEFYVLQPDPDEPCGYRALPRVPVYSPIGQDAYRPFMDGIAETLKGMEVEVEQVINEYGAGQLEFAIGHTDPVGAADDFTRVRDAARGFLSARDLQASFAAKPLLDGIGSGVHIHVSIWDDEGRSLLYDPYKEGSLSAPGRRWIAGTLEHIKPLIGLTAPSYNSSRRFAAGMWAGATTSWGYDNREAAVRIASPFRGREQKSINVEFKPADGTVNPYLALGGLLLAGLDGIERGLEPPEPCPVDPSRLDPGDHARYGIEPLPASLGEALDQLEGSALLSQGMGPDLHTAYLAVKRSEVEHFNGQPVEAELRAHSTVF